MPSKYQEYRQMADTAERQLTSSYKSWTQSRAQRRGSTSIRITSRS